MRVNKTLVNVLNHVIKQISIEVEKLLCIKTLPRKLNPNKLRSCLKYATY